LILFINDITDNIHTDDPHATTGAEEFRVKLIFSEAKVRSIQARYVK
jgi:hypothetical protein